MMPPATTIRSSKQVVALSGEIYTVLTTPWMLAAGGGTLRVVQELQGIVGATFRAKAGWRKAAVRTDDPNSAWTDSATTRSTEGQFPEDFNLAVMTDQMWVQARIGVFLSTGTTPAEAFASIRACMVTDAVLVASAVHVITPSVNSAESAYLPLGTPHSAGGLTGYMFAFIVTGVSGTLGYGPAYRTFDGDVTRPGAWSSLASYSTAAAENRNSGTIDVTPGTKLLIQPGLKVSGAGGAATVRTLVAGIYA